MIKAKQFFIAVLLLVGMSWANAKTAGLTEKVKRIGPLFPSPAMALYVVKDSDAPTTARLAVRQAGLKQGDRLMIRVFDPDEELIFWHYVEPGMMRETLQPGEDEIYGIPIAVPMTYKKHDLLYDADVPLNGRAGVYQIRVSAGAHNSAVTVDLPNSCDYGVSFQNGYFKPWGGMKRVLHAYVPPRAEVLELRGGPVKVYDSANKLVVDTTNTRQKATCPVPAHKVIWRFELPEDDAWRFSCAGFPVILCENKQTAERIKASVEVLDDGTVVSWKFQKQIRQLLPDLLKHVGRTDELVADLANLRDELKKDPIRNVKLVSGFSPLLPAVNWALRNQNLNPDSHWCGAFGDWQAREAAAAPENRWDRLRSAGKLWAGISESKTRACADKLACAATVDFPGNPYYGKRELIYRVALSCLQDLMTLGEDEVWRGISADTDPYPGFMGFVVAQKTFPPFALAAPKLPPEVRTLWTAGLRHIVDRSYPDGLVSARNQSSHYLVAFEDFAVGSGSARYKALAKAYAQRFIRGARPAGYMVESMGPDSSYIGMTHWHMAKYCRVSGDEAMNEAIGKSYRFFNHTVAPEPDGTILGGFNFNHRVGQGFHNEQWSGAKGLMDGLQPEVALWSEKRDETARQNAIKTIDKFCASYDVGKQQSTADVYYGLTSYNTDFSRFEYWEEPRQQKPWPAQSKPFITDIGGELVAVKRPAYYAAVYVGKPAPHPHYVRSRNSPNQRTPYPDNAENTGGKINSRKNAACTGGGLSLLWTPIYGNAILAADWSPLTHHGLLASTTDGKRYWEDYFATTYTLDKANGILTVCGKVEQQPVSYCRTYAFDADKIRVKLALQVENDLELARFIENIPALMGALKKNGVKLTAAPQKAEILDNNGKGLVLAFAKPQKLSVQENGLTDKSMQIGRIEVALPTQLKKGQQIVLEYDLIPQSQ
jgi:hypothetical protein